MRSKDNEDGRENFIKTGINYDKVVKSRFIHFFVIPACPCRPARAGLRPGAKAGIQ